jgi:hypothetical protein
MKDETLSGISGTKQRHIWNLKLRNLKLTVRKKYQGVV